MKRKRPTPDALLVAIRAKCMDCSGNARTLVERCNIPSCPLYPYRSVKAVGGDVMKNVIDVQIGFLDIVKGAR